VLARTGRGFRLLEIGEAVKALPEELLSTETAVPWSQIARMCDHLAHRYFDQPCSRSVNCRQRLMPLLAAVQRLIELERPPGKERPAPNASAATSCAGMHARAAAQVPLAFGAAPMRAERAVRHNCGMSRVVFLHIGAPKTGTTYLQDRLDLNGHALRQHGVHFPTGPLGLPGSTSHFKAALDLMGMDWGGSPGHAQGQWEGLMRRVRRLDGTVIISHEILAAATSEQIARAMGDLRDDEVHLVYSARDLARQVPAVWQESIKQGRRWSFKKYLRDLEAQPDVNFWKSQSLPGVLSRWSAGLTPDRVHLITVPRPGARADLLWERFCRVVGIKPEWARQDSTRVNPSMGVAETAMVRRLNKKLRGSDLTKEDHRILIKEMLVQRNLANRVDQRKATLPPRLHPWAERVVDEWVDWIEGSGIDVVGDLDELYPIPLDDPSSGSVPWVNPDRPGNKQMLRSALVALTAMTEEAARRQATEQQLSRRVGRVARRLRRSS